MICDDMACESIVRNTVLWYDALRYVVLCGFYDMICNAIMCYVVVCYVMLWYDMVSYSML